MAVYAYVQSAENDGTVLIVKDNELKNTSADFLEFMPKIREFMKLAHNQERPTYIKKGDQHIFVSFHRERDEANRRRQFLLSWNTADSKDMILETAKKIGVTDEFDYNNLEKNKSKPNIIFYILIIVVVTILYKLFQK
ncbi:MAG: hypothetical protein K2P52_06230 [Campylobacterales bacterium]|nr:hypothetical protein [Campylobacterales bacterium]